MVANASAAMRAQHLSRACLSAQQQMTNGVLVLTSVMYRGVDRPSSAVHCAQSVRRRAGPQRDRPEEDLADGDGSRAMKVPPPATCVIRAARPRPRRCRYDGDELDGPALVALGPQPARSWFSVSPSSRLKPSVSRTTELTAFGSPLLTVR